MLLDWRQKKNTIEKQNVSGSNLTENNTSRNKQEGALNRSHMYNVVRIKLATEFRDRPVFFSFSGKFKSPKGAVFCEELN